MGTMIPRFEVRQIAETFGATISGIRIAGDVAQPDFAAFLDLFHRYHVVVVPTNGVDPGARATWSSGTIAASCTPPACSTTGNQITSQAT